VRGVVVHAAVFCEEEREHSRILLRRRGAQRGEDTDGEIEIERKVIDVARARSAARAD
jgi:hypothetical protein